MTRLLKRQLLVLVVVLGLLVAALPAVAVAQPPDPSISGSQTGQYWPGPGRNDYTRGFQDGYRDGYTFGFRDGRNMCRRLGHPYQEGLGASRQDDYNRGYSAGFSQGYNAGFTFGCRR